MRVLILLLLTCPLWGATAYDPDGGGSCASRPCIYTITCAGDPCDAGEVAEVQTAIDDAECGDTIKLEAGKDWPAGAGLVVQALGGSCSTSNRLTITSTKLSECPPAGQQITQAYMGVMPNLQQSTNSYALGFTGNATPATNVLIQCVAFEMGFNNSSQPPLKIGNSDNDYSYALTDFSEQPDDIICDQCLVWSDYDTNTAQGIVLNSRAATIQNSRIVGVGNHHDERQGILIFIAQGPITLSNIYVGNATENVMVGGWGGVPALDVDLSGGLEVSYSIFTGEPNRHRPQRWAADTIYFKGALIGDSVSGDEVYRAMNSGTSDSGEPTWDPDIGDTVVDNDITWKTMVVSGTIHDHFLKNRFELKTGQNVNINYSTFSHYWYDGQTAFTTFKAPDTGTCPDTYPTCYGPDTGPTSITNSVYRHGMRGPNWSDTEAGTDYMGNHVARNILFYDIDSTKWNNARTGSTYAVWGYMTWQRGLNEPLMTAEHITMTDVTGQAYSVRPSRRASTTDFSAPVRYNIFQYGATGGYRAESNNAADGTDSVTTAACDGATPDATCWDDNIFIRAAGDPGVYPGGGLTIWLTDDTNLEYVDADNAIYKLGEGSTYQGAAADGKDIGVDFLQLPMIKYLRNTPLDDKILFEWEVSGPIQHIPCAIEVSTNVGFDDYVTDLDPDTYAQPDSSDHDRNIKEGARRMAVVGANSALSASTTHYYRLQCGGDTRQYEMDGTTLQSVATLGALSSTSTVTATYNRSGSTTLEYGTAYSRSTDTISSGGTDVQSCSGSCVFSFTATRGEIYYYRIQGESVAPQVLAVQ